MKKTAVALLKQSLLGGAMVGVPMLTRLGVPMRLPAWLEREVPALQESRKLLGVEAYGYLYMIAHAPLGKKRVLLRIAEFLCLAGLPDQGLAVYEALLAHYDSPENTPETLIVSYLQMMMFGSPEIQSHERIYNSHVYCSRRFISASPYTHYDNKLTQHRRLKIGYTCHFITNSTSATLLQPLLAAHHRDKVEVFVYSDEPKETVPDTVRGIVEHWRDTKELDTDAFCELVRRDGIDILLELNGHGIFNRYLAIARHPAPVQMAWYNYACTTGVPGMDYVLTSDDIEIEALQPFYSETIFRKTGSSHAMTIGAHFPPLTPSAFKRNGYVTFGSFGQAHKVSREQILLWCEVMKRVPGSRFFMKALALGRSANRAAFLHHFRDGGIDASRLILEGNSDYATLLGCYERIDIALDTFPANAGTTTIEATIMGVPVISLTGERYSSQTGRSILEAAGHPELLCRSRAEFVEKAAELAQAPERLAHYRETLREDFRRSRRCDIDGFMTELEEAYSEMWKRFIGSKNKGNEG